MIIHNLSSFSALIIFVAGVALGQGAKSLNMEVIGDSSSQTNGHVQLENEGSGKESNNFLLFSAGVHTSSILHEDGPWRMGYTIGIMFTFKLSDRFSLVIPVSRTRINAAPRNVEDVKDGQNAGDPHYKTFSDWNISFDALEIPLLISYQLKSAGHDRLIGMLGASGDWRPYLDGNSKIPF